MNRQPLATANNYAAALSDACRGLRPGHVYSVEVYHDDWCALLAGKGPCNCNPEVVPALVLTEPGSGLKGTAR